MSHDMKNVHPSELVSFPDSTIDMEIEPLVRALNSDEVVTLSSCCGHGNHGASIDLSVKGLQGIKSFVHRCNAVQARIEDVGINAWLDVALNWQETVATACDFASCPDWVMLSMSIEFGDDVDFAECLRSIAQTWDDVRLSTN